MNLSPPVSNSCERNEKALDFLAGGGEMGALMRAYDWACTPLGPPAQWPQSLKTAIRIMLTSRQPIWIGWGQDLLYFYNDPYKAIIGGKHPWALGRPTSEVWQEIWSDIGPMLATAMTGDEGTYVEEQLLIMERNGYPEETYYTFSYSPIPSDGGGAGGIICANTDDTKRVIGERQITLLRELAARTAEVRTWQGVCARGAEALSTDLHDLPFAMIYMAEPDGRHLSLVGATGIAPGHAAAPVSVALDESGPWPFAEVLRRQETMVVGDLAGRLGSALPTGAWQQPPAQAAALSILPSGETGRAGVLIAGINPFRVFDADYQGFLRLVAGQIAAAVANADAYEEERRRAEALAELDRAKTAFFSNVSHEFRTPLTLMLGPLEESLAEADRLLPEERERVRVVHRNGLRLLKLVNSLLDFARIEAGRVRACYEPTDLAELTAELASNFRSLAERAGLALEVDCPALPAPVCVDRDMWEKIVLNLLSNAFKFTFEGSVGVALREREGLAELTVRDTGTGIPEQELPRLFERFHRIEGARGRSFEGSGIGLALVQELVKLHDGTIRVESTEGVGSAFTISIPLASARRSQGAGREGGPAAPTSVRAQAYVEEALRWLPGAAGIEEAIAKDHGPPHRDGLQAGDVSRARILLADDNVDMRDYVRRLLGPQHEIESVADGQAALDAIRLRKPDLVLTDIMMPRLDGFGLIRAIREDADLKELPVIALSARAGEEASVEGLSAGADDYLVKPFSARELTARVESALAMARMRRQTSAALRESEARFRSMADNAPVMIWTTDPAGLGTYLNRPWYAFTGQSAETGLGDGWLNAIHPDDRNAVKESFRAAVAAREAVTLEYRLRRHDGAWRWAIDTAAPWFDQEGAFKGYIGSVIDMTERKRVEALRIAQNRVLELAIQDTSLSEALETLVSTVEAQSETGMICSVLLLDEEGLHLRHGAAPHLPPAYAAAIDGIAIGPRVGSCGTAAYRKEPVYVSDIASDPLWADFRDLALGHGLNACWSTPIATAQGGVVGTFAMYYPEPREPTAQDRELVDFVARSAALVIEHKRAETALRHRTVQIETLLDEAPLGTYLIDADFRIRAVNPAARQAFGNVPDLIGRDFSKVLHVFWPKAPADDLIARFRRTLETGEPYFEAERSETRGDCGATKYYRWQIGRLPLPDGRFGVVCYFQDISTEVHSRQAIAASEQALRDLNASLECRIAQAIAERAKVEEQLHQAQKMEAIGKLTGGVAHDFNNLLQVVSGNLQLLARDLAGNEKAEQRLRNALAGVARGSKLAAQLLAFGRRQPLAPKVVNLGRLVRGLDDMLRRALGEEIGIETIIAGGLWNTLIDPNQVENAVLNLAINARDAMKGRGRLTIEAGNAFLDDNYAARHADVRPGQYVMLAVTDTGGGIPADIVEHVFEPFFTTKPEGQGTGLGLSMVYGFVKQSGGHIKIYSEPGQGTTIRIYLPRVRQEEDAAAPVDSGPVTGGAETVLVVEDDEDVRATVVEILSELGYRVLKAKDAQCALVVIESGAAIDLLFTDVVMPGPLRSPELARKAQERLPSLAVLFTSGYTDNAIVHGGRLDEGVELLSKPYTREALARKIRHVLLNRQQQNTAPPSPVPVEAAPALAAASPRSLRILHVDDDELIRQSTGDLMAEMGHTVLEAADARQALALLDEQPIDVMITDVGLPGLPGHELARQALQRFPDLRIVFASGKDSVPGQGDAALANTILLRKPYNGRSLSEALARATGMGEG